MRAATPLAALRLRRRALGREFTHPLGVAERIDGVLRRRTARTDRRNHHGPRVAHERLLQDLGELGAAEGNVILPRVEATDALLQRQQRLVNLRALHSRLLVVFCGVARTLRSC